jgi:hypothetical protein
MRCNFCTLGGGPHPAAFSTMGGSTMANQSGARKLRARLAWPAKLSGLTALVLLGAATANAVEVKTSGRLTAGSVYRTEAAEPALLTGLNAATVGLQGLSGSGANADDANLNFRRNDAVSTVLKGLLDVGLTEGGFGAFVRVKAWRDFALRDRSRAWGNVANGYRAGQPLSDNGAPPLSRFSGIALGDYYVQQVVNLDGMRLLGRVGQQSLPWGERVGFAGGLDLLNPRDLPAIHRPGFTPEEGKVPVPALFGRIELTPEFALEGFYQTRFRPTALDMCGTFGSTNDYMVSGCDKVMSGQPITNDRERLNTGAFLKRIDTPKPTSAQFGVGLNWKSAALATDFGLYAARYTGRSQIPSLRKSSRVGPALIAGDPGGMNIAFFTEYPEAIRIGALTFNHKSGATSVFGEVSYRPNQPLMFAPTDVLPGFLNPAAPSLIRADITAVPSGGLFHAYDRYKAVQAQLGVQHDWRVGASALSATAEVVTKRVFDLPDQTVRRYARNELFGLGPIGAVCVVNTADAGKQCSQRGYVSSAAYAARLRVEGRWRDVLPSLNLAASSLVVRDLKGWSYDGLINEGRNTLTLALRFEYRQRYLAEVVYNPNWGGDYNAYSDRDTVGFAVGVKF